MSLTALATDSPLHNETSPTEPRRVPILQVDIRAKFVEIKSRDILKIGVSLPTSVTCLGFLAGVQSITNLFTITNTWHSLSLTNFTKINKKSNSVKYAVKNGHTNHLGIIKLRKGTCYIKIKNKWSGLNHIPKIMGVPLSVSPSVGKKDLYVVMNVLEQMSAEKGITVNYSVSPKGVMKIKTEN
jgi:hypothetical protein